MTATGLTLVAAHPGAQEKETDLQQRAVLEKFLSGVERRALRMAWFAVGHHDDALDIVQEAMLKLVRRYPGATGPELPLLFFRILRNAIVDHQRRSRVRGRVMAFFGHGADNSGEADALADAPASHAANPPDRVALDDAMTALDRAVADLPGRQQQVFLLRALEGLDVAATAAVMGCSDGSVKTHYSRAVHRLRQVLGEHWP